MLTTARSLLLLCTMMLALGCAESTHQTRSEAWRVGLPPELEQQLDRSVEFPALQANPEQFVGRTVMLGGLVLSSRRKAGHTEIEFLELPLLEDGSPQTHNRMLSRGRFLAIQGSFLDPAVVPSGTPLSVIGEITGHSTRPLDESQYTYPVLTIRHLIDWSSVAARTRNEYPVGYYQPFYYGPGLWGPYGGGYPFWGYPPVILQQPLPPPPPPSRIPPQFQKRR